MKHRKPITSTKAITLRLCTFALIIWTTFTFFITFATAEYLYSAFWAHSWQTSVLSLGQLQHEYETNFAAHHDDPATFQKSMDRAALDAIIATNSNNWMRQIRWNSNAGRAHFSVLRNVIADMQTATIIYDRDGNILRQSGSVIIVDYWREDAWGADLSESMPTETTYIALGEDAASAQISAIFSDHAMWSFTFTQITGYFVGAEFIPIKFSYIPDSLFWEARERSGRMSLTNPDRMVYDFVRTGWLQWQILFDNTDDAKHHDDLITIYGRMGWQSLYDAGRQVRHQGRTYDNLLAFLDQVVYPDYLRNNRLHSWGFISTDLFRFGLREVMTFNWATFDNHSDDAAQKTELTILMAISGRPLSHAVSELLYIYIASFIIIALSVLILRKTIRRKLILPTKAVNIGFTIFSEGRDRYRYLDYDDSTAWQEPLELISHYEKTTDKLLADKNELTRLNTALDYAKEAEQNRRQLTSNIAHELKTPLAIIHSYAEGLKAHIADEKREQYLDVILEESERMDAMVLEMLDLSRLEAGKVKLARNEFSLTELVQSTFDKFDIAIREKELNVTYTLNKTCVINADEARISQVILNFSANAIKYTPHGGHIHVKTSITHKTVFSIENDSTPLTREALSKVWEPFYQADNARTGKGSGLGLAIAKNIIELHGGKCFVQNTETGVKFGFTI
ncbi:MAG: HAMP domain-containing histidine kinase [Oscillospiraceae bacterium]|nr:HAMP domain-containing histidine kinase [Oscillospiraceae bacterium]